MIEQYDDEAWRMRAERRDYDSAVSTYATIDSSAEEISSAYWSIRAAEMEVTAGGDYERGSAKYDDQLLVVEGSPAVLLTAEHATKHVRTERNSTRITSKAEDYGTGGLALLVSRQLGQRALIAVGRQTGDANHDAKHVLKERMTAMIEPKSRAHLSLHQMMRGHAATSADKQGFQVLLGMGADPSEATKTLVYDHLLGLADDMGLRIGANQPHLRWDMPGRSLLRDEDGAVRTTMFAGAGQHTTRSHSQALARGLGVEESFVALQVELSSVVVCNAEGTGIFPSQADLELGAFLGHAFVSRAVELARTL